MKLRLAIASLALLCVAAAAYQVHVRSAAASQASLTSYVPQDALLTIESPDFGALLQRWSGSAQSKAWLASGNYAAFQNSRLFGRLGDAQTSFEAAAGVPVGVDLLHQVAGRQSVFAWYDIGKLQFLYITRMSASQAAQTDLLRARGGFQRRHAGNADFYIKAANADYATVAFAQVSDPSGDLLLLATREDLIANALTLIAEKSPAASVAQEPWFQEAAAALPVETPVPALRMVLNLDRIAHDPHFQSYWIQRNITWTRQFRSAVSDLYLDRDRFREERALIPKTALPDDPVAPDLVALAALAPAHTGVVRAVATHDPAVAATAIEEKLLGADLTAAPASTAAPDPDLNAPQAGTASDLEVRIDALPPVSAAASSDALRQASLAAGLDAVVTLSSAREPSPPDSLWVPIHSAIILHAAQPWDAQAIALALQQALRGSLTAATLGIGFRTEQSDGVTVYSLNGAQPLFFAVSSGTPRGNLLLLADQLGALKELLQNLTTPVAKPQHAATFVAVFDHQSQRQPYRRLASLIDGVQNLGTSPSAAPATSPAFFSGNLGSLSATFSHLQSERIVERTQDSVLRQTVVYAW